MSDHHRRKAWQAGYKAALDGQPPEACKRPSNTIYYDDWHDGYNEAARQILTAQDAGEEVAHPTSGDEA